MPKIFIFYLLIPVIFLAGCSANSIQTSSDVINEELLQKYIFYLASDSLMGRDTPSAGLDTAAVYIANEFKKFGLQPVNGSYFQTVKMGKISLGKNNYLKAEIKGKSKEYLIKKEFTPFEMTGDKEITAPVVFAGYGIDAPEYNYNDYEGINVKGKIVFLLRHEPGENDAASKFDGLKPTDFSEVSKKVEIAISKGAAAVMVVQDPLNHTLLTPRGFPWPSLSKLIPQDALPISLLGEEETKVPVIQVGEEVAADLFGSVDKLKEIQSSIDESLKPMSFEFKDITFSIKTETDFLDQSGFNVVGILEGSDPVLKNEVLVIGAHYDHVGFKKNKTEGEDYIFNGADDNASGTGGMMSIAAAFGSLSERPKRSVLFIAFAGEEKGLFGSKYYVNNPLLPVENTIAMLNLDMIGRNHVDSIFIEAADKSPDLKRINEEANKEIGFTLLYPDHTGLGGSDHASFIQKGVPAIFYFSGIHADYHQTSDNPDRINYQKAVKTAKLAFRTAYYIANDDQRYTLLK